VSRPTAAFRRARRCYGHLAGEAGVALREQLEAAGLLRLEGTAYRLTDAGRHWAESLALDIDDRHPEKHARCCLDGTEKQWHVGGRLGVAMLTRLLERKAVEQAAGRELVCADMARLWQALEVV
jgi:hypothetical protein